MTTETKFSLKVHPVPFGDGNILVKVLYIDTVPNHAEEDGAMLCSKLSRTPMPMENILAEIAAKGSGPFIEKFLIGYGHASIGNCGWSTLHVEGCSMLAAKALESHPKFGGQECSTRYLDFVRHLFVMYYGQDIADLIVGHVDILASTERYREALRQFYADAREPMVALAAKRLGVDMATATPDRANTVRCVAFDVLRGFLPAGAVTNVAICLTLRDMADHLQWLYNHELPEVRAIAVTMHEALNERHPFSFKRKLKTRESYPYVPDADDEEAVNWINASSCKYRAEFAKTDSSNPDQSWNTVGPVVDILSAIDFACYRDLQRHTSVARSWVRLRPQEFEQFYIESLPADLQARARELVEDGRKLSRDLHWQIVACRSGLRSLEEQEVLQNHVELMVQYLLPMGFKVKYAWRAMHSSLAYILPLRTAPTVHPMVRADMRRIHAKLTELFTAHGWPENPYKVLPEPTMPDFKRGTQTIELKK